MVDLITDNFDIWATAQTPKSNGNGNGSSYGIRKLRELILELAVRGKLVHQDPNDEPASVLLRKIAKEKARLVKEGKIKKQEPLPEIAEDEKLFELPDGWGWVRLGNFVYLEMGQSPPSTFYNQECEGIPFFQGKADFGDLFPAPRYWCTQPQKWAYPGDILLSVRAPVGPTNVANIDCCIGRGLAALRPLGGSNTNFLLYLMRASQHKLESLSTGTTFAAVSKTDIEEMIISIPPVVEQHRIVAKVDELMNLCDQLEQQQTDNSAVHQTLVEVLLTTLTAAWNPAEFAEAWQRIAEHFDTMFTTEQSIDQLKQTILQLAVMGKLVAQDPNDEPASVLLKKIVKEKTRLAKAGEIKKEKPLPEISNDEKPFELPKGWEWARLGNIADQITDGTHLTPVYVPEGIPFLSVKDMSSGYLDFSNTRFISPDEHEDLAKRCNPQRGDLLLTKVGTTGVPVLVDTDKPFSIFVSVALIKFPQSLMHGQFLALLMRSPLLAAQSKEGTEGIGNKNLVLRKITMFSLVVPPLAEQHRIVAKVDELLKLCDTLKGQVKDAHATQIDLADAVIEHAIAS